MGIDAARQQARVHLDAALKAISQMGDEAGGLRALAKFVVDRNT